ncbi:uncharacterized protein LOC141691739 [Apium graveolens]|uniref:uncharacterized protein LOC141691739 n=1 Tax=Apium graveolens TaxID=4045 RepID=UPI003D796400
MDAVPGSDYLDPEIVEGLLKMLDENNKLSEGFRCARDRLNIPDTDDFSLILYPLLFPYGDDEFHLNIPLKNKKQNVPAEAVNDQHPDETRHRTTVTMREYYSYKLMIRPDEGMNLHLGGRLWQQFVIDAFAAVEQYRLDWIRNHQSTIRSDLYRSIRDSLTKGDTNPGNIGKNVILPVTHTGSQRYMNQYFKDSLAICRTIGHPSLFLTMTCNTQWPKIKQMMEYLPRVDVANKPDVIARVFKLKLDQLLDLINKKNYFGKCIGVPKAWTSSLSYVNMVAPVKQTTKCAMDWYNANTFFDDCGFPVYRRRRTEASVLKKGVLLDNQNTNKKDTPDETTTKAKSMNEIKNFLDGRYICVSEAAWRLLGFDIHHRFPSVERLLVYMEDEKYVSFKPHDDLGDVAERAKIRFTKLEGWFEANKSFPEVFGRLSDVHSHYGETFILRMLLMHIKGATSYQNLKTINGFVHNSFQEACDALGLLKDDRQWDVAMSENAVHAMPRQLRQLFVHILSNNQVADPLKLWERHWESMSEDILLIRRRITNNNELHLNQSDIQNFCLAEIEKLFNDVGKCLKDYNSMPFPEDNFMHGLDNRLLFDGLSYYKEHEHEEHDKLYKSLNKEQLHAYASIIDNVENGKEVLPVASSGIAATLLPGGRTTHSRFHIPLKVDEYSVAHRYAAESVDRSLRDIMTSVDPERASLPFGGITIIFRGDFRQILHVIPKASRAQVVSASLNSSKIWDHCQVFLLEKNMRLSSGKTEQEKHEIAEFNRWVLDVGNGTLPNVHPDDIISDPIVVFPDKFLIRARENPLKAVVDVIYPDLAKNIKNADYLRERSILTPTNAIVGDINSYILDQVPGKEHSYFSQDSLVESQCDNNDFGSAFPI